MIVGIKGRHNSGKTTLIEKLIKKFKDYRIVVVKTSSHETIDVEKSDTHRYRKAGATAGIIVAEKETVIFTDGDFKNAIKIAEKFFPDLIILEGYRKIENIDCMIIDIEKEFDFEEVCSKIKNEIEKRKILVMVDGNTIRMNEFVKNLFHNTILSMVSSLKEGEGNKIEIFLKNN